MVIKFISIIIFPEFFLTIGVLLLLILGLFIKEDVFKKISYLSIFLLIAVILLIFNNSTISYAFYNTLFTTSQFILLFKVLVTVGCLVTIAISTNYLNELNLNKFEIPILLLFSTLGMMILISSNNLMSMYLGIELQSLSLYVVAAINRNSVQSSEAGVKYFVLGALSSGILLYGCSLIYGFTGSTNFEDIRLILQELRTLNIGILFGLIFILVGLAFKISAVPFHMWTPDVYEGAPTAITAFFAIVPKLAGVALIYRVCLEPFGDFVNDWRQVIIFLSILSMFVGAFAALVQKNLKRLLAYSSIGHIGYVLIGLAAANSEGIKGLVIYMIFYLFMNIGIFTIILSMRIQDQYVELLKDLSGLSKRRPIISLCIAIIMFSMAGIPPFAGFFGKFYIFIAAIEADLIYLAVLGVISSVIAAYYYLRIIKIMYFDSVDSEVRNQLTITSKSKIILLISILIISLFVIYPSFLTNISDQISSSFFI